MFFLDKLLIPNNLTLFRVFASLLILFLDLKNVELGIIILLCILAGISDFLDGILARSRGLETDFGAFLDPFADKFFIIVIAIVVVRRDLFDPLILFSIFLSTEIHTFFIPIFLFFDRYKRKLKFFPLPKIKPNKWGRLKTAWLMGTLSLAILGEWLNYEDLVFFAQINLWISFGLGILAEFVYFRDYFRGLYV